jgi:hypothetical protein
VFVVLLFFVVLRAFMVHDYLIQHEHERTSILYHIHHVCVCACACVNGSLSQIGNF